MQVTQRQRLLRSSPRAKVFSPAIDLTFSKFAHDNARMNESHHSHWKGTCIAEEDNCDFSLLTTMVWKDNANAELAAANSFVVGSDHAANKDLTSPTGTSTLAQLQAPKSSEHRDDDGPFGLTAAVVSTPFRLQCGYERNCSKLYKQIESEEWDGVRCFLETGYCKFVKYTHSCLM
jgi:hypothetical protein